MGSTNPLYLEVEEYFDGKIPWPVIELMDDHKKYGWINAESRKPGMAERVLVTFATTKYEPQIAFYSRNNRGEPDWFDIYEWKPLPAKPSHWMKIPRPPVVLLPTAVQGQDAVREYDRSKEQ